ncbi:MAG: cupin domain-containing protein [Rhizobiales bacterium]|nr:cupin domain-containing protein [Hyphomicrobiales bacterium]MBI3673912.1 cupin domain-containing protein [Hyphomicrobiales bacterium]
MTQPNTPSPTLRFRDTLVNIRLSADDGNDGIAVLEHRASVGEAPPLHIHRHEDEIFHLLRGKLRFEVGGRSFPLQSGDVALAPKGVAHRFIVESADGAHWVTITRGHDFETMVKAVSRPAASEELPAQTPPSPAEIEALIKACAENGIDIVGPPFTT